MRVFQSIWMTAVLIIAIAYVSFAIVYKRQDLDVARREVARARDRIDEARLNSTPDPYIDASLDASRLNARLERQARIILNYKKPDEKVVHIYRDSVLTTGVDAQLWEAEQDSNISAWWHYLIGR